MDATKLIKTTKNILDTIEYYSGTIGEDEVLLEHEKKLCIDASRTSKMKEE